MLYASGTTTLAKLPLVSAGIMYGGASAPAWTAAADFTWDQTNKRVGIGTTTPLYPLHVEKNQDATTYTLVYNPNSGASARSVALANTAAASVGLYSYSSGYTTSGGQIASGSAIGATGSNGLSIIATAATGSIRFYTSSTSAFRGVVSDTGNWGFGTDSTAPTSLIYAAKNQNSGTTIAVLNTDTGVNAAANVVLYTTASTGLELTSPGASSPNQLKLFSPLSGGLIMESSNASGFFSVATGGTYPGSERFRIDSSGNVTVDTNVLYVDATNNRVGIGRTNPSTVLDVIHTVAGNAAVNMSNSSADPAATARYILNNSATSGGLLIRSATNATEPSDLVVYSSANNLRFYTGGAARAVIKNDVLSLTNNMNTTVFSMTVGNSSFGGATIMYTIEATDGTNHQCATGLAHVAISRNAAGTFGTGQVTNTITSSSNTSGTLTVTWAAPSGANPSLVQVNANSSLAVSAGYPRIRYTIIRNGAAGITLS
jgi:hypothetical protein